MSQKQALADFTRLLARWPIDRLRPEQRSFQRLLQNRIDAIEKGSDANSRKLPSAEREINAANLLLDNAFAKHYPLSSKLMQPASDPAHYEKLARELEDGPDRTFVGRIWKRIQGMVRMR